MFRCCTWSIKYFVYSPSRFFRGKGEGGGWSFTGLTGWICELCYWRCIHIYLFIYIFFHVGGWASSTEIPRSSGCGLRNKGLQNGQFGKSFFNCSLLMTIITWRRSSKRVILRCLSCNHHASLPSITMGDQTGSQREDWACFRGLKYHCYMDEG